MPTRLPLPLEGIRIIDFSIVWAGPYATLLLGDMGAELIRVDSLQHPDVNSRGPIRLPATASQGAMGTRYPNRTPGDKPWERTNTWNYAHRHKKSVTIDLSRPSGLEIMARLIKVSDAILDNNAAGTLQKLGLTYELARAANPQIVMIQCPGYGMGGPYQYFKGYGANLEALCGHTLLRGYPDMDPSTTYPVYHADPAAGASIAFAIISALHYRNQTGEGQYIDMAQIENVIHHLGPAVMDYAMNQRVQGTLGNRDPSCVQGVYRCQGEDAWVAISIGDDEEWEALCRAMGRPELAQDPRFADAVSRYRNHDAFDAIVSEWTADKDHYDIFFLLQDEGVTAAPVLHPREAFTDPHLKERGFFEIVVNPASGVWPHAGPAFDMSKTPIRIRQRAPLLGEHNEYVYKELMGYSQEEYDRLVEEKHIGNLYTALQD